MKCKHLVVVAGLPCSGKSYLLANWRKRGVSGGPLHEICATPLATTTLAVLKSRDVSSHELGEHDLVLLHYDLFSRHVHGRNRKLPALLDASESHSFITVFSPSALLRQRHDRRIRSLLRSLVAPKNWMARRLPYQLQKDLRLWALYRRPRSVARIHADWLDFIADCPAPHYLSPGYPAQVDFEAIPPTSAAAHLKAGGHLTTLLRS